MKAYRVSNTDGRTIRSRTSGKTWEWMQQPFDTYWAKTADEPMCLLLADDGTVWLVYEPHLKKKHLKMQELQRGLKKDVWPTFLIYDRMMESR